MKLSKIAIISLSASVIIGASAFVYSKNFNHKEEVIAKEASYAFDIHKPELLTGFSSNVFVGTVTGIDKEGEDEIAPFTIYNVKVDENIKGDLNDEVKVLQYIGHDKKHNLVKYDDDNYLKENQQVVFYTRYDDQENAYKIGAPVVGSKVLTKNNKEKELNLAKLAKKNEKNPIKNFQDN